MAKAWLTASLRYQLGQHTCTILSNSLHSLASILRISSSILLAKLLEAEDCSFRFRDIIAAVCDAAVADSVCAVCVSVLNVSSSLLRELSGEAPR